MNGTSLMTRIGEALHKARRRFAQAASSAKEVQTMQAQVRSAQARLWEAAEEREQLLQLLRQLSALEPQGEEFVEALHRARALLSAKEGAQALRPPGETGFMCGMDFDCELGERRGGVPIYSSIEDLLAQRSCVRHCGIVKVRVALCEWVQPQDFAPLFAKALAGRSTRLLHRGILPRQTI